MKALFILLIITYTQFGYSATQYPKINEVEIIFLPGTNSYLTIDEFLKLKPSDFKRLTGKKLTLKEVFALKFTQAKIKTAIRKNRTIDTLTFYNKDKKPFKWHWGGFFLGLFLPFIGLLIAGIIKKDERKWDRINSAAIATAIISIIFIFIVFKSLANSL